MHSLGEADGLAAGPPLPVSRMTRRDCLEFTIGAKRAGLLIGPMPTRLWVLPLAFTALALTFALLAPWR